MLKKYFMVFGVCLSIILLASISIILGVKIRNRKLAKWGAKEVIKILNEKFPSHDFSIVSQSVFSNEGEGYGWRFKIKEDNKNEWRLSCSKDGKKLSCDNIDWHVRDIYKPQIEKYFNQLFKEKFGGNLISVSIKQLDTDHFYDNSYNFPGYNSYEIPLKDYLTFDDIVISLNVKFSCVTDYKQYKDIIYKILEDNNIKNIYTIYVYNDNVQTDSQVQCEKQSRYDYDIKSRW